MRKQLELLMWVVVLALGVALLANYRMQSESEWIAANSDCDLQQQGCVTVLDDGSDLRLSITPHPIVPLKPLSFEVTMQAGHASQLWLEISGVNMEMGVTRVLMTAQGNSRYIGSGILPICSVSQMEWRIRVVAITQGGGFDRAFRLMTTRG